MADYLGDFAAGVTLQLFWNTTAIAGESITRATNGSIRIYKNNSDTERTSSAGITDTEDADSLTGMHRLHIDLSDNTDAGFYAAGNNYAVVLVAATIDGKVINQALGQFSIENRFVISAAAIRTALGLASANLDTQLGDLPTNAELATSQAAADDATLAAIAALNNLSAAQVNAEADTALADYDAPTNAEMVARTLAAADYATATALDAVDNFVDTEIGTIITNLATAQAAIDDIPTNAELATSQAASDDATLAAIAALNNLSAAAAAAAVWNEDATGHQTQGSFGQAIGDPVADTDTIWGLANTNLNATVSSRASQVSVDDLPTNAEISTALGTADDATLAAIAALNNLSAAGVRTAVGLASANLDTQLDALPTNAELATALGTADDAILAVLGTPAGASVSADIAAIEAQTDDIGVAGAGLTAVPWNVAWDAEVQSEVTDALNAYDPPTKAELDSAVAPLATQTSVDTLDNFVDTEVAALLVIAQKLDTALELDGLVYRFTLNALELAPAGGGLDAAGVRAAVGLASANLDTQLGDLPTNAELATSQASADDATLAAIASLNNLSAAQVNAEVLDVLSVDTFAEPSAIPAATASLKDKLGWMALLVRNRITQTATTTTVFADDGSTPVAVFSESDNGTTLVVGEGA